jgi:elongation factor Ts
MPVTAQQVKELRDRSGVGLGDCKRALEDCGGDMEAALQKLRERGLAKAAKRSGRETREGRVVLRASDDSKKAAMVEVNCETDFVARNDVFGGLCEEVGNVALAAAGAVSTPEALLALAASDGRTLADVVHDVFARTGEVTRVGRVVTLDAGPNGVVGSYLHYNLRVGIVVDLGCDTAETAANPDVAELGRNIAMHIAMASPEVVSTDDLSPERVAAEKTVLLEQTRQEKGNIPEATLERIVAGRLGKFYEDACLLEQPYIRDEKGKTKVKDLLAEAAKRVGGTIAVRGFTRYSLDESAGGSGG